MRNFTLFFIVAISFLLGENLKAQIPFTLLKDINAESGAGGTFPEEIVKAGPFIYFSGATLHRTDGTPEGTVAVKNVVNGDGPHQPQRLTAVNDRIFFTAVNRQGNELWVSNGTDAGTFMVKDIHLNNTTTSIFNLTASYGYVFFVAFDPSTGYELWKSDGSSLGTTLVKDISPGNDDNPLDAPTELTDYRNTLYFSADDGTSRKLWKTNGTPGGTSMVKDVDAENLHVVGNTLYFAGYIPTRGYALYKTDGSTDGTVIVKDDWPGTVSGDFKNFTTWGDTLYFTVNNQLWKSNGTQEGTTMVTDAFTGIESLAVTESHLYFIGETAENGRELWRTNGTTAGTTLYHETAQDAESRYLEQLTVIDDSVFFTIDGMELWRMRGTEAIQISGDGMIGPHNLTAIDDTLYFVASRLGGEAFSDNDELWRTDGTEDGTLMLSGVDELTGDASPSSFTPTNTLLYFMANDQLLSLPKVWRTDGTAAGTFDLGPTAGTEIVSAGTNDDVFFLKYDDDIGNELWKSDGTSVGTTLVKDVNLGPGDADLRDGLSVNGDTYLVLSDGTTGLELWMTDGTDAGTTLVKDIVAGPDGTAFGELAAFNNALYFVANDGASGSELWTTDGTAAGTKMLSDINPGSAGAQPHSLTVMNSLLYFFANDEASGNALWRTDGTDAGTERVTDFTGGNGVLTNALIVFDNALYFFADDGTNTGLWKSDGTTANTVFIETFDVDEEGTSMAVVNGKLFFNASDGIVGNELWLSDGAAAGTSLVKDIYTGPLSSNIKSFLIYNNALYFLAEDRFTGYEVWKTDGVDCGAVRVTENDEIFPEALYQANSTLIAPAKGGATGYELYYYNTSNDPQVAGKIQQIITFNDITPKVYGDVFALDAVSSEATPIAFKSVNPSLAEIAGSTVTIAGTGDLEIMAYQPGDNTHCPADPVVKAFVAEKAMLQVQPYDDERVYGDPNSTLSFSFNGFVNNDDSLVIDQMPTVSTSANDTTDVGEYDITVGGGHDDHYNFNYLTGTLAIEKAPLTATADNKTIAYGNPLPALTITYDGFRNNDDDSDITPPSISTDAEEGGDAGEYAINVFDGDAANYIFNLVPGVLTIEKAVADIAITNLIQEADGTPKSVAVTTNPQNLNHIVTYNGSTTNPLLPGTYEVLVQIDEQNYRGEKIAQLVLEEIMGVENEHAVPLSIYSNPVDERLTIEFEQYHAAATQVAIYSMQGQLLYRKHFSTISPGDQDVIQVQDWSPGVYHLIATDVQGKSSNYRIVKR
jgi:ELWxxDGT repeat protein